MWMRSEFGLDSLTQLATKEAEPSTQIDNALQRSKTRTGTLRRQRASWVGKPAEVRAFVEALFQADASPQPDAAAGTVAVQFCCT